MLQSVGVQWALAGHSERRMIFGEDDEYINGQCRKLIDLGMSVMLCIGETLKEHEFKLVGAVCALHLKKGLAGIKKEEMSRVAIAYEPVWAIGTGLTASPEYGMLSILMCCGLTWTCSCLFLLQPKRSTLNAERSSQRCLTSKPLKAHVFCTVGV